MTFLAFSGPFFVDVLVSFWQLSLDTNAMKYMFRWLFGEDVIIHISVLIYYYTYRNGGRHLLIIVAAVNK